MDNACWARTGVTGPTIAEEINMTLIKHKLIPFHKSSKGRIEGANAFKQRLVGNEMKDGNYKPAIYFFKTCYNCLRTIPMLGHDKQNPETYDTHGEDHATDAVIYACLSRPFAPMRTKAKRGDYDAYADKPKRRSSWTY